VRQSSWRTGFADYQGETLAFRSYRPSWRGGSTVAAKRFHKLLDSAVVELFNVPL
jgi:hypothetical protein